MDRASAGCTIIYWEERIDAGRQRLDGRGQRFDSRMAQDGIRPDVFARDVDIMPLRAVRNARCVRVLLSTIPTARETCGLDRRRALDPGQRDDLLYSSSSK